MLTDSYVEKVKNRSMDEIFNLEPDEILVITNYKLAPSIQPQEH